MATFRSCGDCNLFRMFRKAAEMCLLLSFGLVLWAIHVIWDDLGRFLKIDFLVNKNGGHGSPCGGRPESGG